MNIAAKMQEAVAAHQAGQLARAAEIYREVLRSDPRQADANHLLGVISWQAGKPAEARELISRAIAINPKEPVFHQNIAGVFRAMGEHQLALAATRQVAMLEPNSAPAQAAFGELLFRQGHEKEAAEVLTRTVELDPNRMTEQLYLGDVLQRVGRVPEAIRRMNEAVRLFPDFADLHALLAVALLKTGDFDRGWNEYQWRWRSPSAPARPDFPQPHWDGQPLAGKTILLAAEQGYGDTIQFVRYAKLLKEQGARVALLCHPVLRRLLTRAADVDVMVGDDLPPFDYYVTMLELPRLLRTRLETIPNHVPYVSVAPGLVERWSARLGPKKEGEKRIGLVWAGNPKHVNDANRSITPEALRLLAAVAGARFYRLRKLEGASDATALPIEMTDLTGEFEDFADTAAVVMNLDLVISVDTVAAHLAGALGRPVWTLLPSDPDWRWLLGRRDSPWYPTMRLFRQPVPGDWPSVVRDVVAALRQ